MLITKKILILIRAKLFGDTIIYSLANVLAGLMPFLLIPLLTNKLTADEYGKAAMFSTLLSFFSVFVGLNLHGSVLLKFTNEKFKKRSEYVTSIFTLLAISTLILFLFVVANKDYITALTTLDFRWILVGLLGAFFGSIFQVYLSICQANNNSWQFGCMRVLQSILDGLCTVILVYVLSYSWEGRIYGIVFGLIAASIVSVYFIWRNGLLSNEPKIVHQVDALRFGLPLIPHSVGGLLLNYVDRLLVTNMLDVRETGIYLVAVQFGMLLGIFLDSFNKAYYPWLMKKLIDVSEKEKRSLVIYSYTYFFLVITCAVILAIIGNLLIPLIVGEEYYSAVSLVIYTLIGNAFTGMYYMVANFIFFSKRTELLSLLTISIGISSTIISITLINIYGVIGAALGFAIGQCLLFIGAWYCSYIAIKMPWTLNFHQRIK